MSGNYFQKLTIENFQSHSYTEVQFVKGLNVFAGPSDSGKSAILRALRWVLFNKPRGDDFIREGSKKCSVTLQFADGTEIVRTRSTSFNRYILRTPDGQEQVFESFGEQIPREIIAIHGMQAVKLGNKEVSLHYGEQLDAPFLLIGWSGGDKAKMMNRMSETHLIDQALKKLTTDRNTVNQELKSLEKQAEQLQEKLSTYDNLEELDQALTQAEAHHQTALAKEKRVEQLQRLLIQFQAIRHEQKEMTERLERYQSLAQLETEIWKLESVNRTLLQLSHLAEKQQKLQTEKVNCQRRITSLQPILQMGEKVQQLEEQVKHHIQLHDVQTRWTHHTTALQQVHHTLNRSAQLSATTQLIKQLDSKITTFQQLQDVHTRLNDVQTRLQRGKEYHQQYLALCETATANLTQLFQTLGRCPTCGSPVNADLLEHLITK